MSAAAPAAGRATRPARARSRVPGAPSARTRLALLLGAAAALARGRLSRCDRRDAGVGVLDDGLLHRQRRAHLQHRTTCATSSPIRCTARSRCARSASRCSVTVIDAVIAFPIAFYMSVVARRASRRLMVVAVLTPLWASYLVKAYAWRTLLAPNGPLSWLTGGHTPGYGLTATVITLAYLWLPYMVIPVYAGFERVPRSLFEASADLGAGPADHPFGARAAGVPGDRGRLDLHLLADPRRLHRRRHRRWQDATAGERDLRPAGHRQQPAAGGRAVDHPAASRSCCTCSRCGAPVRWRTSDVPHRPRPVALFAC